MLKLVKSKEIVTAKNYILNTTTLFGNTYNCGAYGASNYNENACDATTTSADNSSLSAPSTGLSIGTVDGTGIGIGLILVVLAAILLKKRKQKVNK